MCGIAGFLSTPSRSADELGEVARRMTDAIAHRGPDDEGVWTDERIGVALGNRRLAVIDTSSEGHQPMGGSADRYVITYNGEIYNFRELRRELEAAGRKFRGGSDTEVLLAAVEAWGVQSACRRFNGMFAFALWDRQDRLLHLARDRSGKKPLYYGRMGSTFLFGSELKCLRAHPDFKPAIDRDALTLYMRHNYVPGPLSIYRGVSKLPPGTVLTLRFDAVDSGSPVPYWSAAAAVAASLADPFRDGPEAAVEALEALLNEAVARRRISDVPLGALLSGGIDSSTVVALMQAQSSDRVKTFTIGFHEQGYDEASQARAVASHLGTDHNELYVTPEAALDVIPHLPAVYDEPFADSSQIPTYLISKLAREHVTVALSGDGGDEVFGGYSRHLWGPRAWRATGWMPQVARQAVARSIRAGSPEAWDRMFDRLRPIAPGFIGQRNPGDKLQKLADALGAQTPLAFYQSLVSHWEVPEALVKGGSEGESGHLPEPPEALAHDFTSTMMYMDMVSYLPDDILVKVDRASMRTSLEARAPLLDNQVVEFAWRLPLNLKVRNGVGKWVLRQVLLRHVPRELVERPKAGFGVPIGRWLRGPLNEWAEDLLDERLLRQQSYFDPAPIRQKWDEHLSGRRNWQDQLWGVLMFQAWLAAE